jgi:hypothetical protein
MQRKRFLSVALVTMLLLSMVMTFGITPAFAQTTYISVINPDTGDTNFIYNMSAPPPAPMVAEVTLTDVINLAGWQVNLTYDPTLLTIADPSDVYAPAGHVFDGLDPQFPAKNIDNVKGFVFWSAAIGPASPEDHFDGSGIMMTVEFTVIAVPNEFDPVLSCDLELDLVSMFPTAIIDPDAEDILFTAEDGYYEYSWIAPPPQYPWLEISPYTTEVGLPLGPPMVGTANAFFTVDILVKNVTTDHDLIGVQSLVVVYNNTLLRCYNPLDPAQNVTEGTFMNNAMWAPYGTTFIYVIDYNFPAPGLDSISIGCIINPNDTTTEYDWPERPFGDGLFCTLHFEVLYQEVFPWEETVPLDSKELFPGEMFLNSTLEWIEFLDPIDGYVTIYGYIMGRQIDLYVGSECSPYPYPYGGQGPNATADMFLPQKLVCMWANVTYNMWPVQAKDVAFEIIDPTGETLTVVVATTDEDGVAHASFRIPWPCDPELRDLYLCGTFTIIASVDIACEVVKDWLWFHFDYLVRWDNPETLETEVIIEPGEIGHCGTVAVTVRFWSKALLPYDVLITCDLKDELQVPIGFAMGWVTIGDRPMSEWCTYDEYEITFYIHIPKWAFAGVATAHINALSTLPSLCGFAYCPELLATFTILAEWA